KAIAGKLSVKSQLKKIPRKRFEEALISGQAHLYCKANPAWFKADPSLDWSKPIYREKNIIVSKKEHAEKKDIIEFKNLTVGTTHGYKYAPNFEAAEAKKIIHTESGKSDYHNLKKVELNRIHAAIVSDIIFKYYQRVEKGSTLVATQTLVSEHEIHCLISKKNPFSGDSLKKAIEH